MNLLHLIATLDPAAGGTSESVRVLLEHAPPGYTAEVVTLDDPAAPFLQAFPFKVHALGPQTNVYGSNKLLVPWLRANRHRFDGVFVNGMWQFLGLAAMRALHRHTPYIVITHGMLDPWFKRAYPLKHLKKWAYWLPIEYWVLRRADRVLFTTHEEARLAQQTFWLHRWQPHVAAIGAARPPATPRDQLTEAFHARVPAARGKRFVLFLGRIHVKKGCDLLIEAFARVAAKDPTLHLVMAGPDQQNWSATLQQTAQEKGIADRVLWPGMLKDEAKWGAFYASEVFILPSHQENFGIAVAEALACARPALLAAPVNIAPEIAEDRAGLVQPDTLAGTERLLLQWIALPPRHPHPDGTERPRLLRQTLRHAKKRRSHQPPLRSPRLAFALPSVIPEENLLLAFALLSVIPEGNLLLALALLSVIPEGNLLLAFALLPVIPEGNLLLAFALLPVIPEGNLLLQLHFPQTHFA